MSRPPSLRIFISSPGDVAQERERAKRIIKGLAQPFDGQLEIVPVLWEDLPLGAHTNFQDGIEVILSEKHKIDIAVFILWARMGTPLKEGFKNPHGNPYLSGTEREFDLMLAAREESGGKIPHILVYERDDDKGFDERLKEANKDKGKIFDLIEQRDLAKEFIQLRFRDEEGRNIRAYHTYPKPERFSSLLKTHLKALVSDIFPEYVASWDNEPYRGLGKFEKEHAPIFQGRNAEAFEIEFCLATRLADRENGVAAVVIVGPSGSGKSSLALAGVAANLADVDPDDEVKEWRTVVFRPAAAGASLFYELVRCLSEVVHNLSGDEIDFTRLAVELSETPEETTKRRLLPAIKESTLMRDGGRILLVLDQLEELWTNRNIGEKDREKFLRCIVEICRRSPVSVLATLRSDFYPQAQDSEAFLELKSGAGHFDLLPPKAAALQQIISVPARISGWRFEYDEKSGQSLDQLIFEDAAENPGALPLLEYALAELYKHRNIKNRTLNFAAYEAMGGVKGALGKQAEACIAGLPQFVQAALPGILPHLVDVSHSDPRPVARLAPQSIFEGKTAQLLLISELDGARFITSSRNAEGNEVYGFTHETVLDGVDRIREWIKQNQEFLRLRNTVESSEERWRASGKEASLLLSYGVPLAEGRRLLEAPIFLYEKIREFVHRSIAQYEDKKQRKERVRKWILGTMAMLMVAAVVAGIFANWKRLEADEANAATAVQLDRSRLEEGKAWLERGRGEMERKENLAAALYIGRSVGYQRFGRDEAESVGSDLPPALLGVPMVADPTLEPERIEVSNRADELISNAYPMIYPLWSTPIRSHHRDEITSLAFSPDGKVLASASADPGPTPNITYMDKGSGAGVIKLWDVASGEEMIRIEGHDDDVNSVVFSPDGSILASGSTDKNVALWDPETGKRLKKFEGHLKGVTVVSFNADGSRLISGSSDATLRIWDVETGDSLSVISGHEKGVTGALYSADGSRIISCSKDGKTVRVWNAHTGDEIQKFTSVTFPSEIVASPDGQTIIAPSFIGQKIVLWDTESGLERPGPEQRHRGIASLALDPSGTVLTAGSRDGTVQLWDFQTLEKLDSVEGLNSSVGAMTLNPTGDLMAAAVGSTIRLWEIKKGRLKAVGDGQQGACDLVAFSPDGERVACSSGIRVTVLDSSDGAELGAVVLENYNRSIQEMIFTPDGSKLVILPSNGRIQVCDLATWEVSGVESLSDISIPMAISGNLSLVAEPTRDHLIKIFDWESGNQRALCSGHTDRIVAAAFRPDGRRLASLSWDKSLKLWDTETGEEIASIEKIGLVAQLSFSPDGSRLASIGTSLEILDAETLQKIATIEDEKFKISSFAFSPSGAEVATCRGDGIRLWDVATGEEIAALKGFRGRTVDVAFCPTGTRVATASLDGTTRLWDVSRRNEVSTLIGHDLDVNMYSTAPEQGLAVTAGRDRSIRLWDLRTGVELAVLGYHNFMALEPQFTPDSKLILSSSSDSTLRVWEVKTGALQEIFEAPASYMNCTAVSPDSTRIAVNYKDIGGTHVWERGNRIAWRSLVAPDNLDELWFSADGERLAGRTIFGGKKVWDLDTGEELEAVDFDWENDAAESREEIDLGKYKLHRSGLGPAKVISRFGEPKYDLLQPQLDGMVDISGQDMNFPGTRSSLTKQHLFSPNTTGEGDLAELSREDLTAERKLEIVLLRDAKCRAGYAAVRHWENSKSAGVHVSDEAHRLYVLNLGQQVRIELARLGRDRQVVELIKILIWVLDPRDLEVDGISVMIREISTRLLLADSETLDTGRSHWLSWLRNNAPPEWWDAQSHLLYRSYEPDSAPKELSVKLASLYDELLAASPNSPERLRIAVAVAEGADRETSLELESRLLAHPNVTSNDVINAAYRASKRGERERSLQLLGRVIAKDIDRKDPSHLRVAGLIYVNLGEDQMALKAYQDARALVNSRSRFFFDIELGIMTTHWLGKNEEEAITMYQRFLTTRRGGWDWTDPNSLKSLKLPSRAKKALAQIRLATLEKLSGSKNPGAGE